MSGKILITGGTGFIGKALVRHLAEAGYEVRLLIRPSKQSPNFPRGLPIEVAVSSLTDERGLRSAMLDVEAVYHLAGAERRGVRSSLLDIDILGSQAVSQAAAKADVRRFFYLSHLGADRASAYPVFKAKAIAEEHIRSSGVNYTILRSAIVYGLGDSFTSGLARLLHAFPFLFFIPEDGRVLLQPLWVEDLATCLTWALDNERIHNQVISIGGPEYLSFNQITQLVMENTKVKRTLVYLPPVYMRALTVLLEFIFPSLPVSVYWLDYLAVNRTCALDTILRMFNLLPGRFSQHLEYLHDTKWGQSLWRLLLRRQ